VIGTFHIQRGKLYIASFDFPLRFPRKRCLLPRFAISLAKNSRLENSAFLFLFFFKFRWKIVLLNQFDIICPLITLSAVVKLVLFFSLESALSRISSGSAASATNAANIQTGFRSLIEKNEEKELLSPNGKQFPSIFN